MESLIAPNFAHHYSQFFGCSHWSLLVISRAITTWVVTLGSAIILAENCIGGWKRFWLVCTSDSKELDFQISLPNALDFSYENTVIQVTATSKDVCSVGTQWYWYHRCDRAVLEYLTPFLTTRLAVSAFGQPILYLLR